MKLQTSQEIEAALASNLQAQRHVEESLPKISPKPLTVWTAEDQASAGAASMSYQWLKQFREEADELKKQLRLARIDEMLVKLLHTPNPHV